MNNENNNILSAVSVLERVIPRMFPNSRETIKRQHLIQIQQTLTIALRTLSDSCKEPLVLTPIMECLNLIDTVIADNTFVETDAETKELLLDRIQDSLNNLYMFAGKFYMTHTFMYNMSKVDILRHIIDYCLANGYYFDYDKKLRAEGVL